MWQCVAGVECKRSKQRPQCQECEGWRRGQGGGRKWNGGRVPESLCARVDVEDGPIVDGHRGTKVVDRGGVRARAEIEDDGFKNRPGLKGSGLSLWNGAVVAPREAARPPATVVTFLFVSIFGDGQHFAKFVHLELSFGSNLFLLDGVWKISPKNPKCFNFFPSGQKRSQWVGSKCTRVKGGVGLSLNGGLKHARVGAHL